MTATRHAFAWCGDGQGPGAESRCAGFTASKLLWMKRKEPHNFARLRHVLLPHDYVNYWLTGAYCMEAGDASGTGVPPPPPPPRAPPRSLHPTSCLLPRPDPTRSVRLILPGCCSASPCSDEPVCREGLMAPA